MNVSTGGALVVLAATLLLNCWPFIVVPMFIFLKRRSLTHKWVLFFSGLGLCFVIYLVVSVVVTTWFARAIPNLPGWWYIGVVMVSVALSVMALVLLSRAFRPTRSPTKEPDDGAR